MGTCGLADHTVIDSMNDFGNLFGLQRKIENRDSKLVQIRFDMHNHPVGGGFYILRMNKHLLKEHSILFRFSDNSCIVVGEPEMLVI